MPENIFDAGMNSAPASAPQKDALGFEVVSNPGNVFDAGMSSPAPQRDQLGFTVVPHGNVFDAGMQSSQDPFKAYGGHAIDIAEVGERMANASSHPQDPFAAFGGQAVTAAPARDQLGFEIVGGGSDPFAQYGGHAIGGRAQEDPNAPVWKKVWSWLNKPLIDVESTLGRTQSGGPIEKGVTDLISGLSSPLSLALTIGSFGAGGLAESAGASVLRSAGMAAGDIGEVTRGAKILADTLKTGRTAQEGIASAEAAGINPVTLSRGLDTLTSAKMGTDSLLTNGLIRRGGGAVLRKFGVGPAQADLFAQGVQSLINAGFTVQNAYSAVESSPRVLDALKSGDTDTAIRLGINALGSGTFAALGGHEFAKESGGLRDLAQEKLGLKVKPTQENTILRGLLGEKQAAETEAGYANTNWVSDIRKQFKDLDATDLQRTANYVEAGSDRNTMAERYNALAEAAGRPERMPVVESPENGSETPATSGMSAERIRQAIDSKALAAKPAAYVTQLLDSYDPRKITTDSEDLAKLIQEKHNDTLQDPRFKDVVPQGVANYISHLWKDEDSSNAVSNTAKHQVDSGSFPTSTTMARTRLFDSAYEGQLLGKELKVTDPVATAAHNANTFAKLAANRSFLDALQDKGVRASDGRPIAVLSGSSRMLDGEEGRSVMINPGAMRSASIPESQIDVMKANGDLARALNDGTIKDSNRKITMDNIQNNIFALEKQRVGGKTAFDENGNETHRAEINLLKDIRDGKLPESKLAEVNARIPPSYQWSSDGYRSMDMHALKDWSHVATTPDGQSIFLKSDLMLHPEAADYMERILGKDPQGVGGGAIGKTAQKINSQLKGIQLSMSVFHTAQEAMRGIMTGVSPFGLERIDLAKDPVLRNGVEAGLVLGKDRQGLSAFQDGAAVGHSALIDKIPVARTIQHGLDKFLFDSYIPSLKVRAYKNLVGKYEAAYPGWTEDKIARTAADHTNSQFGGLNFAQMGRSAASQNWLRLGALAPDFAESELRSLSRLFGSEGKVARANALKATVGLWAAARVANMLISGKQRLDVPFGVAIKDDQTGQDKVYSMRTLPTDALHVISDPEHFLRGRLSPIVKVGTEFATGRDQQGRRLDNEGMIKDLVTQATPIVAQNAVKSLTGAYQPEMSTGDQIAKAAGFTVTPLRSESLKLAQRIASDHSVNGPVDPEALERHQKLQGVEDQLYSGRITTSDIAQAVYAGSLSQIDARRMVKNWEATREMTPEMASLYIRASHLPTRYLLDVFDQATPEERQILAPLVRKSGTNYIKSSITRLTPVERQTDPTLRRVMQMMPTAQPY